MSEIDNLESQLHDALIHLYDLNYLHEHPLAVRLGIATASDSPGRALRRLLLELIQELKPAPGDPVDTQTAARYHFLYLRYVQAEEIEQVARKLSIGRRQAFRRQHDALEAVSIALRRKRQPIRARSVERRQEIGLGFATPVGNVKADAQPEIDTIGLSRPQSPLDLAAALTGVVATVSQLAEANGRQVVVDVGPSLPLVLADRVAVRQALLGILVYVIVSYGSSRIKVKTETEETSVRIRVQGEFRSDVIPPDQLYEDTNLAVSKRLIEMQGGLVTWRTMDRGLGIVVHLPLANTKTILVVDDNRDAIELFTRYLETSGYQVLTSTGKQVVQTVTDYRPDAVILDVMLPSTDGWEILHALRTDPASADVPVVVCTVLRQEDLARSLGATEFVLKPVTQEALLTALHRCWSAAR